MDSEPERLGPPPVRQAEGLSGAAIARLVIGGILLVAIIVFCARNTDSTKVDFLFWDSSPPLFLVIILAVIAGVVLGLLAGWVRRRRARPAR